MIESRDTLTRLLSQRRSCRSFTPDPVDEETLQTLSEAFALAPQAGGGRHLRCRFILDRSAIENLASRGQSAFSAFCRGIESPFIREEMERYGKNFFWFGEVPVLAVVTCRPPPAFLEEAAGDKARLLWGGELSAGMAAFAMLLAAENAGLGACCLTGPIAVWREMEHLLDISRRETLVLLITLGYKRACHD